MLLRGTVSVAFICVGACGLKWQLQMCDLQSPRLACLRFSELLQHEWFSCAYRDGKTVGYGVLNDTLFQGK